MDQRHTVFAQRKKRRSLRLVAGAIYLVFGFSAGLLSAQSKTILLNGDSGGATFYGIGAVSAGASSRLLIDYPEPERNQILDYLFKPGYGAALQHLKVEVGADVNSTDGSEPSDMRSTQDHNYTRGYEWWLMKEAKKRNPHIVLDVLPWGAPGWVKSMHSDLMAAYMADFIEGAEANHLHIDYTGIYNEMEYDPAYVKALHKELLARHLKTKIVCCDEYGGQGKGAWAIADAIKSDPELASAVDVIAAHYPQNKGKLTTTQAARDSGRPLWSSEDQPNSGSGPYLSRDWPIGGRILAHLYNKNYIEGGLSATEIWSPVTSYYDILAAPNSGLMYANTPWSGHYDVQGTIWATAHTTQFTEPGWQYLDQSSGHLAAGGSYVTLRSQNKQSWSTVVETIGTKVPVLLNFEVSGGLPEGTVHVWETNSAKTFVHVGDVTPEQNKFSYSFDPDSLYTLTTTTGQGKGNAVPPPARPFPSSYKETFEEVEMNRSPQYLADQDGAFAVHACIGRRGKCLEQTITTIPLSWGPLPDPFTMAGGIEARNYTVRADFRMKDGDATLLGRIESADVFEDGKAKLPAAYVLSVDASGAWRLVTTTYKKPTATLAQGHLTIDRDKWHQFALSMRGDRIIAGVDGTQLADVHDGSHTRGFFGIGSGWNVIQFDNLFVTPGPDTPAR